MLHTNIVRRQDQYITNSLDCALKEKPKKFWSYIKSKKQDQIGIPPLNGNGKVLTDSTSKAEVLSNRFRQIFTKEDLSSIPSKMIPVIIDLSPLLLCYVKSWNISFIGTLCTILRTMSSYLRTNLDFGKIIHVNLS